MRVERFLSGQRGGERRKDDSAPKVHVTRTRGALRRPRRGCTLTHVTFVHAETARPGAIAIGLLCRWRTAPPPRDRSTRGTCASSIAIGSTTKRASRSTKAPLLARLERQVHLRADARSHLVRSIALACVGPDAGRGTPHGTCAFPCRPAPSSAFAPRLKPWPTRPVRCTTVREPGDTLAKPSREKGQDPPRRNLPRSLRNRVESMRRRVPSRYLPIRLRRTLSRVHARLLLTPES